MAGRHPWPVPLTCHAMIDIQTKIHDQFSIEFKVGFSGREDVKTDQFDVNSWIFIPNGLNINESTYSKDRFYSDMKSNIRLRTPSFSLREIVDGETAPIKHLQRSLEAVLTDLSPERLNEYEFQLKLFGSIFKSSIRDASALIINEKRHDNLTYERCMVYMEDVKQVLSCFRDLAGRMEKANDDIKTKYAFTDEFMSHQVEIRTLKIYKSVAHVEILSVKDACKAIVEFLGNEREYKVSMGYSHSVIGDNRNNRKLLHRHSLLKKYIESALFLRVNTTQDGKAVKQISFSLAAGLAMMVYLLVTMPFQKYLGNYPSLIFFILVLFYILKDRIKELTRWLFAYQLKDKYYDNRIVISIKHKSIGWIKEGMDFITDDRVPEEVLKLRDRSVLEADNQLLEERIILYRKKVEIDNVKLKNQYDYDFKGINDIIRYHINYLTKKMDNPVSSLDVLDEHGELLTIKADRVYTMHFVMQFKWEDQIEYKVFHVLFNRNGIVEINS